MRREFLKMFGLVSLGGAVMSAIPIEKEHDYCFYDYENYHVFTIAIRIDSDRPKQSCEKITKAYINKLKKSMKETL